MTPFRQRLDSLRSAAGLARSADVDALRVQLGSVEARVAAGLAPGSIREAEFKVFSQFGEDGIIEHLVRNVPIENEVFVEFGVEDYRESNTRFLLVHRNWRGLIIDGGEDHVGFVTSSGLRWRNHIDTVSAFIDRDNIDGLIRGAGIEGDIGLLSVDIDGNDYWVLESIESVSPRILVAEYNSVFGPRAAVSVPYDPAFVRGNAHYSHLYWGASLAALTHIADRKGYALVGGNSAGNNIFFVRRDVLGATPEVSPEDAWVASRFRESRAADGSPTYIGDHAQRVEMLGDVPLVNVVTGTTSPASELLRA